MAKNPPLEVWKPLEKYLGKLLVWEKPDNHNFHARSEDSAPLYWLTSATSLGVPTPI